MTGFETRQLVVNGVRSPVLIGGSGPTGEVVVFVHGNPDASSDWEPLMARIAEFAAVVAPDMPGFGGADKRADQDYTLAAYGAHLGGLIDQLGIDAVHLVAHDFGGLFALTWAAANPDKVASVTLINTGVLLDYKWHRLARVWRTPVAGGAVHAHRHPSLRAVAAPARQPWPGRVLGEPDSRTPSSGRDEARRAAALPVHPLSGHGCASRTAAQPRS